MNASLVAVGAFLLIRFAHQAMSKPTPGTFTPLEKTTDSGRWYK